REAVGQPAGRPASGPRFGWQPIDLEPRFLRERRERVDNLRHFHVSRIVEMKADVKRPKNVVGPRFWLVPDLGGDLDDARELRPLLVLGEEVAVVRAREAALRRETKALERHELRRLIDAALETFLRLEGARLGGDEAEHDFLSLWQEAQRPEAAGALAVVFHEEAVDVRAEHGGDDIFLVAAGGEPGAPEVAAAGVHGDGEVGGLAAQRLVDDARVCRRERRGV